MRKTLALITIFCVTILFTSCEDETTGPDPIGEGEGNIFVQSTPAGAEIWLDGSNTNNVTPDTLTDIEAGTHEITLQLEDYRDTTVAVIVNEDQTSSTSVTLTTDFSLTSYGPVRIYETAGTTVDQPSGIDLSSGSAYGISGSENNLIDVYYSTTGTGGQGFLVQSADLSPNMTRVTKFRVGDGADLNDGEDSPLESSGTWTNSMSDRETNYVFLYDEDGHYTKAKIVNFGGGVPGEPAWVEVQWWYNDSEDNTKF